MSLVQTLNNYITETLRSEVKRESVIKKKSLFFKLYPKKVSEDLIIAHDTELWTDKKGGHLVEK